MKKLLFSKKINYQLLSSYLEYLLLFSCIFGTASQQLGFIHLFSLKIFIGRMCFENFCSR